MTKYGLDKFYTNPNVAKHCIKKLECVKSLSDFVVIEPSAGNGAFSLQLPDCKSYDIEPEHPSITKQDFFLFNVDPFTTKKFIVIGNPPFGRQCNLAVKFVNHAATFADVIAFILPKSFKKESIQDRIDRRLHLIQEEDLPCDTFLYNNKPYDVPCVWQVWERRNIVRPKRESLSPVGFEFTSKDDANCSIRRVGVYAGKGFVTTDKSPQSHYFIKVDNPEDFIDMVNSIRWDHNNTVGPRSISKQELIREIQKYEHSRN